MQASGDNVILGINEAELSDFAMDILNLSDDVADIFSSIDSKMELLKNYFDGSQYDSLMNSYRSFRKNYGVVKRSIISYSDDLIAVVNKAREGDAKIALMINQISDDISKKAQNVENL